MTYQDRYIGKVITNSVLDNYCVTVHMLHDDTEAPSLLVWSIENRGVE